MYKYMYVFVYLFIIGAWEYSQLFLRRSMKVLLPPLQSDGMGNFTSRTLARRNKFEKPIKIKF